MIGIVIVTHVNIGAEFLRAVKLISGDQNRCQSVAVELNINTDYLLDLVGKAIKDQDDGDGVLLLIDMFGGTPSNISLAFYVDGKVEVLTGVNLPMILHALEHRQKKGITLDKLALETYNYSLSSIVLASALVK
jgi:PTS system mannose-specific IIA component